MFGHPPRSDRSGPEARRSDRRHEPVAAHTSQPLGIGLTKTSDLLVQLPGSDRDGQVGVNGLDEFSKRVRSGPEGDYIPAPSSISALKFWYQSAMYKGRLACS